MELQLHASNFAETCYITFPIEGVVEIREITIINELGSEADCATLHQEITSQ
jgi:hypothetical protein